MPLHSDQSFQDIIKSMYESAFSKSKIITSKELDQAHKKLKAIKYPVRPISNAMYMKKKLNSFSPAIQKNLEKHLDTRLNAYRQVRGDGNCFFRAFAFSFIVSKETYYFNSIFSHLDDITLDKCQAKTIPKQFKPFYNHNLLKQILKKYWQDDYEFFVRQNKYNYKRALSRMLNENHYLDFIIILYFRSLCLYAFQRKKEEFKDFLKGTEEDQITSYGEESEGLILNLCSKFLQMNIHIFQVRKDQVITYEYKNLRGSSRRDHEIYLLFYDNHYDIFEEHQNPSLQYNDQKEQEDYYSEINNNFIPGDCIQCGKSSEISEETGLCLDCFNKSMENFTSFQKDKHITDYCAQCQRKSSRISQQLLICEDCITKMQYSSIKGSRVEEYDSIYSKQGRCDKCKKMKNHLDLNQHDICKECIEEQSIKNSKSNESISKIGKEGPSDSKISLQYSTLQNKLESKISKDKKQQERSKNVNKAQIFERKVVVEYQCSNCKAKISKEEANQNNHLCSKYLKTSKVQSSTVKKELCNYCGQHGLAFPIVNGICTKCKTKISKLN